MEYFTRLENSYPFFHLHYVGQMLKPPHPVSSLAYFTAMLINPNNHALDGGPETSEMEKEAVKQLAEMFGFKMNFGFLWYIGRYDTTDLYNASGYGGQYIYVIPEMKMVIVCTSDLDRHHGENYGLISQYIIPLLKK